MPTHTPPPTPPTLKLTWTGLEFTTPDPSRHVCHRFDRRQLLRVRKIEVAGGEVVEQWVVTAEGVKAFEREIVPMYPSFGRFVVRPNREAERAGLTKRALVIRIPPEA